jgi:hypothetical protein
VDLVQRPNRGITRFGLFSFPAAIVAAVPVALAILVTTVFTAGRLLPVTGDEPHYLVMADGLARDRTFDLRSAYAREGETQRIYGSPLPAPHVVIVNHRWGPYHVPGLPLILAAPFTVGGELGARIALCLAAGLLPLCTFSLLRTRTTESLAAWVTIGVSAGMPIVFGASQIYPDLLAGLIAMTLFLWLIDAPLDNATTERWAIFWLVTGLLPWLNVKFLAATVTLGLAALVIVGRGDRRRHRPPALTACGLVLVGPVLLAAFNMWFFETPLGPRGVAELTTSFGRAAMMFLGLHFDQGQGMFWQQPLLLVGVASLVPFARRSPRVALLWALLYASLIVPNSLELARYGGGGPAGRFAWSAAWLWVVPFAFAIESSPDRWGRLVKPLVIAAVAYQVLLAARWLQEPGVLFPKLEEDLTARNSLFPVAARALLPSFYFWDFASYWTYPPNVAAYVGTALLVAVGGLSNTDRRRS